MAVFIWCDQCIQECSGAHACLPKPFGQNTLIHHHCTLLPGSENKTAPLFSRGFQRKPEGHPLRHFFFGSNLKKETHMFVAVYLSSSVELLLQLAWTSGSVRRIPIRMLQGLVVPFPLFFFVFRGSNGFYIQVFWVTESL